MCVGLTIPPTNWERRVGGWMNSAVCNGGAWRGRRGRRAVQPGGAEDGSTAGLEVPRPSSPTKCRDARPATSHETTSSFRHDERPSSTTQAQRPSPPKGARTRVATLRRLGPPSPPTHGTPSPCHAQQEQRHPPCCPSHCGHAGRGQGAFSTPGGCIAAGVTWYGVPPRFRAVSCPSVSLHGHFRHRFSGYSSSSGTLSHSQKHLHASG